MLHRLTTAFQLKYQWVYTDPNKVLTASPEGAAAREHDEDRRQLLLGSISVMARRRAYRIQRDVLRDRSAGYSALYRDIVAKAREVAEEAPEHPVGPSIRHQARTLHQYVREGISQREQLVAQQDQAWAYAQGVIDFWESGIRETG